MNRYKCYNIPNISFEQLNDLEDNYLEQIHNDYLKKVEIKIENDDININIEPFYKESLLWDKVSDLIKKNKTKFWFRDDDAGIDNKSLDNLMQYLKNKKINLLIAAIPVLCDNKLKIILDKYDNYVIGQHGYSHTNYLKNDLSEYPDTRKEEIIATELINGDRILSNLFKDKYNKVFIPPWFEVGSKTKKLLKEHNYLAISNYWKNQINSNGMIEINSQVDLVDWDNAYTFGGEDYVLNQIISEIESGNTCIGILLHHERIGKETYYFLDKLIETILEHGSIVDFNSILEGYKND